MDQPDSSLRTINRICAILHIFDETEPVQTLSQISKKVNLPKSTTLRLLESLVSQGILNRDNNGKGYQLGYQLITWGRLALTSLDLRNIARPFLRSLSEITGETAILSIRDGSSCIWLDIVESKQPIRLAASFGKNLSLHAGASAKVLIAFLPDADTERILSEIKYTPFQVNTVNSLEKMRQEIARIRSQGYAVSFEETDKGAMGIAAPVFDQANRLIAGLGIAAPTSRITYENIPPIAEIVLNHCRDLSTRFGSSKYRNS